MAVGGLLVFDPEPPLTRAMVAARLAERIHLIPRLRQRLEEPPFGLLANPAVGRRPWIRSRLARPPGEPAGARRRGGARGARRTRVLPPARSRPPAVGGDADRRAAGRPPCPADEGPSRACRRHGGDRDGRARARSEPGAARDPAPGAGVVAASIRPPTADDAAGSSAADRRFEADGRRHAARSRRRSPAHGERHAPRDRGRDRARQGAAAGADDPAQPADLTEPPVRRSHTRRSPSSRPPAPAATGPSTT